MLPGGDGYKKLKASKLVGKVLKNHFQLGKFICTICMAAHVLLANEIAFGKKLTSYPYLLTEQLESKYIYVDDDVVQDGNLITARGPGTVFKFIFKIIENLVGLEKAKIKAQHNLVPLTDL